MSPQHPVEEKGLDRKAIVALSLSLYKNQYKSYYLQLEEIFMECIHYIYLLNIYGVYYVVIYEGYMKKNDMI